MTGTETTLIETAALPRRGLHVLPIIGGCLAMASLGAAMIAGHSGTPVPSVILAVGAAGCLAGEILRRFVQVIRAPEGPLIVLVTLGAVVAVLAFGAFGVGIGGVIAALLAAVGTAVIGHGIAAIRTLRSATPTPWNALRGVSLHDRSGLLLGTAGPLLAGLIMALVGVRIQRGGEAFAAVVITAAVLLVRAPSWRPPRPTAGRPPDEVAAHLHDSVLQTLALIQRSADDPAKVTQLARQQERSLRDWLAGRNDDAPLTVAAAIRVIAAEVEREVTGATIDVVCVGEAPMDRHTEMLTQAAREAMRNAARHGSPNVRVFCETDAAGTRVYVRDTGPGLNVDQVPMDRRGIRDAIIGRMEHIDGTVTIDSGEHGTEIELHLPAKTR